MMIMIVLKYNRCGDRIIREIADKNKLFIDMLNRCAHKSIDQDQ